MCAFATPLALIQFTAERPRPGCSQPMSEHGGVLLYSKTISADKFFVSHHLHRGSPSARLRLSQSWTAVSLEVLFIHLYFSFLFLSMSHLYSCLKVLLPYSDPSPSQASFLMNLLLIRFPWHLFQGESD